MLSTGGTIAKAGRIAAGNLVQGSGLRSLWKTIVPTTLSSPCSAAYAFLASLQPGDVVAQLDDGSVLICDSEEEADRAILASRKLPQENKRRVTKKPFGSSGRRGNAC
jgi:hypothetical protein